LQQICGYKFLSEVEKKLFTKAIENIRTADASLSHSADYDSGMLLSTSVIDELESLTKVLTDASTSNSSYLDLFQVQSLDFFTIFVDTKYNEYKKLSELTEGIRDGEIDQKFLYWEPSAANRWIDLCNNSEYEYHKISTDLISKRIKEIMSIIVANSNVTLFDFVNLGAGGGYKDYVILKNLVERMPKDTQERMAYIPIEHRVKHWLF
jgi:Histidine-specific methyltransferase, SAM-dependent